VLYVSVAVNVEEVEQQSPELDARVREVGV